MPPETWKEQRTRDFLASLPKKLDVGYVSMEPFVVKEQNMVPTEKPKKKITKEVESFIYMQERVLSKLSWHPELYEVLDRIPFDEIWEKLVGKNALEAVPTQIGGKMEYRASKDTKKYFEDMEKKLADEGAREFKDVESQWEDKSGKKNVKNIY